MERGFIVSRVQAEALRILVRQRFETRRQDLESRCKPSSLLLYRDKLRLYLKSREGQVARTLTCLFTKHLVDPRGCPI